MSKMDWLIRLNNGEIIGPVTKETIITKLENGELEDHDEVCSGNGYWVYIHEKALINDFIYGNKTQGFNPVQEAKSFLGEIEPENNVQLPEAEDLDYPEVDDITVTNFDINDMGFADVIEKNKKKSEQEVNKVNAVNIVNKKPEVETTSFYKTYKFVYTLLVIFIIGFLLIIFYRDKILGKLVVDSSSILMPNAIAQEVSFKKKSGYL